MPRLSLSVVALVLFSHMAAIAAKPLVAVAPLSARAVDSSSLEVIQDAIASELVKSKSVRVLERAQMDRILAEQGFQQAACDQNNCSVEMGRLLAVNFMLTGSVGRIGNTYSLSLRMVDVETGEVTGSVTKTRNGDIEAVLTDLLPSAVGELVSPSEAAPKTPVAVVPEKQGSSSSLVWWLAGGTMVVGGGVAAAVLLMDDGSTPSAGPVVSAPTATVVEITLP